MKTIWMVIANCGDGSNSIQWVTDKRVLDRMQDLADEGDESFASGDGLQDREINFLDDFDVDAWLALNKLAVTTLEELDEYFD